MMKLSTVNIVLVGLLVIGGSILLHDHNTESPEELIPSAPLSAEDTPAPQAVMPPTPQEQPPASSPISATPLQEQRKVTQPNSVKKQAKAVRNNRRPTAEQQRTAMIKRWKQTEDQFNRLWDKLEGTLDPEQRNRLINNMAQYVRMNTPDAIEWAMSLVDPAERRLALESINKYALSGIGARIETDDTGYPKIKETTVLSAVGSTGMVEPGDYIIGMVNAEGQAVDFEGMPMHQVIRHLRGEPGSELVLLMERATSDQGESSYPFDVPIQRSLLVVEPPY